MEIREIIGNTTATPNPRPDWNQTDETKADYIKNKPNIVQTSGDSETAVMSQKATTNLISEIDSQINGNVDTIDITWKLGSLSGGNEYDTNTRMRTDKIEIRDGILSYTLDNAELYCYWYSGDTYIKNSSGWLKKITPDQLNVDGATHFRLVARYADDSVITDITHLSNCVCVSGRNLSGSILGIIEELRERALSADDLAQEAGNSTDKPMSQKATTDFVNNKISQETGASTDKVMSQKATADFVSGFVNTYIPKTTTTRNLLNVDSFQTGFIDNNGKFTTDDIGYFVTEDYMPVTGGQPYTFSWVGGDEKEGFFDVFEYKADKTFIKTGGKAVNASPKNWTRTFDAECAFVRIRISKSTLARISKFQMEEGSTATEYVPPLAIDNSVINLLAHPDVDKLAKIEDVASEDEIKEIAQEVSENYISKAPTRNLLNVQFDGGFIDANTGKYSATDKWSTVSPDYISVEGGENYTFSWERNDPAAFSAKIGVYEYRADYTFIRKLSSSGSTHNSQEFTVTLDTECSFVRVSIDKSSGTTPASKLSLDNFQMEKGDTATEYVSPATIDNKYINLLGHPDASKFVKTEDVIDETEVQGIVADYIPKVQTRNLLNTDDLQPALIDINNGKITIGSYGYVSTIEGIPVTGGQAYTVSWSGGDEKEGYFNVLMYKSDNTYIGHHARSVDAPQKNYKCIMDAECAFVRFMILNSALARIDNLQFEEGEATEYIPPLVLDNKNIDLLGHPDAIKFVRADNMTTIDPTAYGLPVLELFGDQGAMNDSKNEVDFTYKYEEREGTCTLKWQGSSSLTFPKKNYTIKFDAKFEAKSGWGEQKKYCLKANYIDISHARNVCGAKLWGDVVKSRTSANNTLKALPNCGAVDGFPICLVMNGKYQGLYTFNIPKDKWMFGMGEGEAEAIVCADRSDRASCQFKGLVELTDDFEVEYAPDEDNTEWIKTSLNRLMQACLDCNSEEDFNNNVAPYLDVESAIDYLIHILVLSHYDGVVKNYILATYDGTKWFVSAYDMDTTFGLSWNGAKIYGVNTPYVNAFNHMTTYNRMFTLLTTYKADKLKARYNELVNGVLSEEAVTEKFTDFIGSISNALYNEEVKIWAGIPSTAVNNVAQITDFYRRRREYLDAQIEAL